MTSVNPSEPITVRSVHFRDSAKLMPEDGLEVVNCGEYTKQQPVTESRRLLGRWQQLS